MTNYRAWILVGAALLASGCKSNEDELLATGESQLALRSMQTRAFDTTDQQGTLRTIIATMQDLEFVIDRADADRQ